MPLEDAALQRARAREPVVELIAREKLVTYARNARTHSEDQIRQIAASIEEFGWTNPLLVDADLNVIAGHGRLLAAELVGLDRVPCIVLGHLTEPQRRALVLADNQLALNAGWDMDLLRTELVGLESVSFDLSLLGFSDFDLASFMAPAQAESPQAKAMGSLAAEFMIPPFSVLNAREGWWQDRKQEWIALGIDSELGRGENLLKMSDTLLEPDPTKRGAMVAGRKADAKSTGTQDWVQRKIASGEIAGGMAAKKTGTSIFDPVLCEIVYRWFSPASGVVLDPFSGGSVRGVVAAVLGRKYHGVDLRAEQIEANRAQWEKINVHAAKCEAPAWYIGDSREAVPTLEIEADLVFSCPPYGDLEVYSDDPADISTMDADAFDAAHKAIIGAACGKLREDRFAVWVVGEYRDKAGNYRNIVGKTVAAFEAAGLAYYGEAALLTAIGSLPIRAAKQFRVSRKLGKTHQNVLIFVKGKGSRAAKACGAVDVSGSIEHLGYGDNSGRTIG